MNRSSSFSWRPKTTLILLGGFTLILIAIIVAFAMANFKPTTSVRVGSGMYHVWLADNEVKRSEGLSGVEKLKINGGLLMDFQGNGFWGIWMKDMKIPLDIIWLDANKKVVHIEADVSPNLGTSKVLTPKSLSRYVLELPAGSAKKAGIRLNEVADFKLEATKQ